MKNWKTSFESGPAEIKQLKWSEMLDDVPTPCRFTIYQATVTSKTGEDCQALLVARPDTIMTTLRINEVQSPTLHTPSNANAITTYTRQ